MEQNKSGNEIDPDYVSLKSALELNEEEEKKQKLKKIRLIIEDEYNKELSQRQEQIEKIQHQIAKVQKMRHLLRYVLISSYYNKKELGYSGSEDSTLDNNGSGAVPDKQSRIHPAVKKLLGKNGMTLQLPGSRNKRKLDPKSDESKHSATGPASTNTDNLEDGEIKRMKIDETTKVSTIAMRNVLRREPSDELIRNRKKAKRRIVIGNISKWIPSSEQDNLTHKWMVYVRGPKEKPDVSSFVDKVVFYLHPSYQPHDVVEICDAPFHLSRRGWGEFPVRVQIFFKEKMNKPVDVVHNLKLDKTYSGRQTLGNETIVDVFLYHEHNETPKTEIKMNAKSNHETERSINLEDSAKSSLEHDYCFGDENSSTSITDNWNVSFDHSYSLSPSDEGLGIKPLTLKKVIYENPENNELIYGLDQSYLEPSREVEIENPQQGKILIPLGKLNNFLQLNKKDIKIGSAKIVILGKKAEGLLANLANDHKTVLISPNIVNKNEQNHFKLTLPGDKFKNMGEALSFLFKRLPLVSELANNPIYKRLYPFTAPTLKEFVSWNIGKKRSAEWSRARAIKKIAMASRIHEIDKWTTKNIVMYGRSHGHTPLAPFGLHKRSSDEKVMLLSCFSSSEPNFPKFNIRNVSSVEPEVTINVDSVIDDTSSTPKKNYSSVDISDPNLQLECSYVRHSALDCGIELKSEEIEDGVVANCPERMIFEAVKCLAESLIRRALNHKICHIIPSSTSIPTIGKDDVQIAINERPELFAIQQFKHKKRNIDFFS